MLSGARKLTAMATLQTSTPPPADVAEQRAQALGLCPTSSRSLLEAVFIAFARWSANLPAGRNYYDHEFGCQAAAYLAAKFAVAGASSSVFAARDAEERAQTQPLYVAAAGLAAVCSVMAMTAESIDVRKKNHPTPWVPLATAVIDFCDGGEVEVDWNARAAGLQPSPRVAAWLAARFFGDHLLASAAGSPHVLLHTVEALMPPSQLSAADSALSRIVRASVLRALDAFHAAHRAGHIAPFSPLAVAARSIESGSLGPGIAPTQRAVDPPVAGGTRVAGVPNPGTPPAMVELPLTASAKSSATVDPRREDAAAAPVKKNAREIAEGPPFLETAPAWCRQWLDAFREAIGADPSTAKRLRLQDDGTAVVARTILGRFGAPDGQVVSALSELGLIVSRETGSVVLARQLAVWLRVTR